MKIFSTHSSIINILRAIAILILTGCLFGCSGGGTEGTGIEVRAVLLEGHAIFNDGTLAQGVTLRHEESGIEAPVDAEGRFSFILEIEGEQGFSLSYFYAGVQHGVSVANIPASAEEVRASIVIDKSSGEPEQFEVEFIEGSAGGDIA